jgi:hypothetical protein
MNAGRPIKREIKRKILVSVQREQAMGLIPELPNYCRTTSIMTSEEHARSLFWSKL